MSELERTITAFLIDHKAQGLSPTTIKAYPHELKTFQRYLADSVNCIDDITPHTIKEYLLYLQVEKGRNPGGCHIAYQVIKTWLFWWELEVDGYTAPIRKVKFPRLSREHLPPIRLENVQELVRHMTEPTTAYVIRL